MISLQHAVILHIGTTALLIDTSLNGTYVNNRRVSRCVIRPNDLIRFGKERRSQRFPRARFVFVGKCVRPPRKSLCSTPAKPTSPTDISALLESIKCPLCKDVLVFPSEVSPCAEYFCNECIETYFRTSSTSSAVPCPKCEQPIEWKLKTNFKLSQVVEKTISVSSQSVGGNFLSDFQGRSARRRALLVHRQDQLQQLVARFNSVDYDAKTGDPFLAIFQTWTEFERKKFAQGIAQYPAGEPRAFFCWMVRLTPEWVERDANQTELAVAMFNLGLQKSAVEIDVAHMQNALLRFIFAQS